MLKLFRKTLAVCLIGLGLRYFTCDITSFYRLVICNWHYCYLCRYWLALLLNFLKESVLHDNSCKKGS